MIQLCTTTCIERIPLGAAKAEIFCKFVRFLGMINGNGLLAPCPNKVVAIVQLERPWDLNTLQQFLGAVNWFRRHISDHAEIQNPLALTNTGEGWVGCLLRWGSSTAPGTLLLPLTLKSWCFENFFCFHVGLIQ
jgi:hypothetical protein